MKNLIGKLKLVVGDGSLKGRLLFLLGALIVFRFLATIPIPGVNTERLQAFFSGNEFLGLLNLFSGGGLTNLSIIMLGVGPFITASIIMQLLTIMSPKIKAMYQEEGEAGRKKFSQYSRLLTVPMAVIQGFGFITLLSRNGAIDALSSFSLITNLFIITAGAVLIMWIGELISEFGVGNGASIIIFAGIVAGLPSIASQLFYTFNVSQIPLYLVFLVTTLVITYGVVVVTEAERPIPITYAKRVRGMKVYGGISTYLPIRLNQAGVIPIIFALSILLFPQMIFNFLSNINSVVLSSISNLVLNTLANQWVYGAMYFILVFLFTYFYTAVTFDPEMISGNLQKSGAFIPGVRPGTPTSQYISKILTRLTLVGALFL
ncbi:MAG: preprotein translocase subunit SecY, partial [Candidatus Zambryskibacteria bacterium CG11_big_fil_rev_8_21_14_0_20_40_24]